MTARLADRGGLPQLDGTILVTDSGLETDLVLHHGVDLPHHAAFVLLRDGRGRRLLEDYYAEHLRTAASHGIGCVLETPTQRASAAWAASVAWTVEDVVRVNREAVELVTAVRAHVERQAGPCLVSGRVGPRATEGLGLDRMTIDQARAYHAQQVDVLAETEVDLVSLLTAAYPEEAAGFVRATQDAGVPSVVSFTVEADGRLPDRSTLADAVRAVDDATAAGPAYYMVDGAHPAHVRSALTPSAEWACRVVGVRAHASTGVRAAVQDGTAPEDGDPPAFAQEVVGLRSVGPALTVFGGCCGTDVRHVDALAGVLGTG